MSRLTLHRSAVTAIVLCCLPATLWAGPPHFPKDRPADIKHIKLELAIDLEKKFAGGSASIDLVALREIGSIRFDAVDFEVSNVSMARGGGPGATMDYINDGKSIEVLLGDHPLLPGQSATIEIAYSVTDPDDGLHFFAPTESDPDTPLQVWSQGQAIENRYWFPCFDHPNEMQTTEIICTVAAGNTVISNGRLVEKRENGDSTVTFHWLQDKPHVSYLVSLVVGEFYMEEESWRGKPVRYYVPPDRADDVQRSFGNTTRMLELFSNLTGVEYPWDQYAQICAEQFGGGMENTSATTLGVRTLHDERAHLDTRSEGLVAHELAHQWFGDYVTCSDWAHLWLNEGFASFMEPVWYEHALGRDEYDYAIYSDMGSAYRGGKTKPVVHRGYDSPGEQFDSRAYPKGSAILHMLRHRVGDDTFWSGVNAFLTTFAHKPVETDQFRRIFERVSGRSLGRFFHDWTERPGAPKLDVSYEWIEDEKLAKVVVKQEQEDDAFHFPLEMAFHFDNGDVINVSRKVTDKEQRFFIPLSGHPNMVLFDPKNVVLKEITEHKGRDLWTRQLTGAPDVVSRILAAKHFGEKGASRDVKLLGGALLDEPFWGVGIAIAEALSDAGGDEARDALLKGLELEHPKVRRACVSALGKYRDDEKVLAALTELIRRGDPSYRVETAAIRAYARLEPDGAVALLSSLMDRDSQREQIRSAALSGIGSQKDAAGLDLLLTWAQPDKPRECRQAAIGALGTLAANVELEKSQQEQVVELIMDAVKGEHRWTKWSSVRALGEMGEIARPALGLLRDVQANDSSEHLQRAAKRAIEKINAAKPGSEQVDDLREALDELREQNKQLIERLEKIESRTARGGDRDN